VLYVSWKKKFNKFKKKKLKRKMVENNHKVLSSAIYELLHPLWQSSICTCVIVAQNIWMSGAEYIPPTRPLRPMMVCNPFKPPPPSSLEAFFLSYIFWISFSPRNKNHAIYMIQMNYLLVNE
jgi:hypothetical protein